MIRRPRGVRSNAVRLRCEELDQRVVPATAGNLDPTFGTAGRVILPITVSPFQNVS